MRPNSAAMHQPTRYGYMPLVQNEEGNEHHHAQVANDEDDEESLNLRRLLNET